MLEMLGQEVSFVVLPTLIGSCWYTGSMSSARPCSVYQSWKEDKIEQIALQLLPKIILCVPSEPQLVDYLHDNPINILGRQDRFFNKTERLEQRRNLLSLIDSYVQVIEFYHIYHLLIYITHPDDSIRSIIFKHCRGIEKKGNVTNQHLMPQMLNLQTTNNLNTNTFWHYLVAERIFDAPTPWIAVRTQRVTGDAYVQYPYTDNVQACVVLQHLGIADSHPLMKAIETLVIQSGWYYSLFLGIDSRTNLWSLFHRVLIPWDIQNRIHSHGSSHAQVKSFLMRKAEAVGWTQAWKTRSMVIRERVLTQ